MLTYKEWLLLHLIEEGYMEDGDCDPDTITKEELITFLDLDEADFETFVDQYTEWAELNCHTPEFDLDED